MNGIHMLLLLLPHSRSSHLCQVLLQHLQELLLCTAEWSQTIRCEEHLLLLLSLLLAVLPISLALSLLLLLLLVC